MKALQALAHLRAVRSTSLRSVARRALTLLPDYLRGKGTSSSLVNITLEITYRCNIKCEFCFLKDNVLNQRRRELSVEEIARLADQARPGRTSFFITGGEPFIRKDLEDVVAAIRARGLKVGVNTNGLLVDAERGRRIRAAGLDYIIFSLHGPKEVHDCLEGREGAFDRVLANLEEFAAHKGRTRVLANCVVAKANANRLAAVPELLADVPIDGLTFQHESFLTAAEVANHEKVWQVVFPDHPHPMVYQSSGYGARDFHALDDQIASIEEKSRAKRYPFQVFFKPFLKGSGLRQWYTRDMSVKGRCLYIWTDTRVEPDGTVNACQVMPTPMGNVRDTPLAELLNGESYRGFRNKIREVGGVFPACARCCKLYRNPMNFGAQQPAWEKWIDAREEPSSPLSV